MNRFSFIVIIVLLLYGTCLNAVEHLTTSVYHDIKKGERNNFTFSFDDHQSYDDLPITDLVIEYKISVFFREEREDSLVDIIPDFSYRYFVPCYKEIGKAGIVLDGSFQSPIGDGSGNHFYAIIEITRKVYEFYKRSIDDLITMESIDIALEDESEYLVHQDGPLRRRSIEMGHTRE